jgi:hypothetical protein
MKLGYEGVNKRLLDEYADKNTQVFILKIP